MVNIVEVLHQLSQLEWWSYGPVPDQPGRDLTSPPHVVWRHENPTQELAEFLQHAVKSFPGSIGWDLTITNRNWLLQPARVPEYTQSHGLLGDLQAAKELELNDPDFGKRANVELPLLAAHIANAAAKRAVA